MAAAVTPRSRLRRRAHARQDVVADPGEHGAEQGGRAARGAQPGLQQERRGGLAVGAGDAEQQQAGGGVVVHPARDLAQHAARVVGDEHRQPREAAGTGRVGEDGDGTGRHHRVGEVGAVGPRTGQRGVQVAGQDPLGAERDARDGHGVVAHHAQGGRRVGHPRRQVVQRRGERVPRAGGREEVVDHRDRRLLVSG
jgi:hypothetical protein